MLLLLFDSCASPVSVMVCRKSKKYKTHQSHLLKIYQKDPLDVTVIGKVKYKRYNVGAQKSGKVPVVDATDGTFFDPTLDFPFLNDSRTIQLIARSKVFFIMRGLSGSGKSTVVQAITETYNTSMVCSADDYFFQNGEYCFDPAYLSAAHSACQNKATEACCAGVPVVIVDNTNVRRWETKYYLDLAKERDYIVILVLPKTTWKWNPVELAARNKHGVDVATLMRKVNQFDDVIPKYYAWFLNDNASKQLSFIASVLLKECFQKFPAFAEGLMKQIHISPTELSQWQQHLLNPMKISDCMSALLSKYYTRGRQPGCLLHCTAKFMGYRGQAVGAKAYHTNLAVQASLGKAFLLEIPSICFSPRTAGARVRLGTDQLPLFDKPEERDWKATQPSSLSAAGRNSPRATSQMISRNITNSASQNGRWPNNGSGRNSHESRNSTHNYWESSPNAERNSPDWSGFSPVAKTPCRSAHITIGCGEGIESRETNFDVLRLCDMEETVSGRAEDYVGVTCGKARYFGDGVCCVYFDPPLYVSALYSGYY